MKQLVIGILAHVDAGKTTLSEALLYTAGAIPALGRVDHRDAYLDTHALERDRGITIFSKQALFQTPALAVTLLDTPGHVDFSAEMERTLQVLDYAILVISATDGVQAHTETLWRLLRRNQIPTFLFVTKMDLPNPGREAILAGLQRQLDEGCADFTRRDGAWAEGVALRDEGLLDRYLETGRLTPRDVSGLVRLGRLFPCYFGAALRLEGVADFLQGLTDYTEAPVYPPDFAARVFKIARDSQGNRLTYAKLTGGTLAVRAPLSYLPQTGGEVLEEKVTQLRLYSGAKYQTAEAVSAGQVCALLGLTQTYPGQGLGAEPPAPPPLLEPVVTYRLVLPPDCPAQVLLPKLRQLEEEDPQLHLVWDEHSQEIHARLMGQVQIEVLQRLIADRFDVAVQVDAGRILYKETIAAPVEGVGHFEPLRHYAEVHLLLEPLPQGSGLVFDSRCSEDLLDRNWQRLILTHLAERTHRGGPHRRPHHRPAHHPPLRPGPPQAHRGGRLPPGHLPGGAPGPHAGRERAAGALVRLHPHPPRRAAGPGHQRPANHGGDLRPPGERRDLGHPHRHRPGGRHEGLSPDRGRLHPGPGEIRLLPPRLRPLPQPEAGGGRRRV